MEGARNLSTTSVFFDFDGTISTTDIGVHVLDRLADPGWRQLDVEYSAGRIGSRDCLIRQWDFIPDHVTEAERRAAALEVPLDAGFGPLVDGLRAAGAEVAVVSDGYGYYAREMLSPWDLDVFANDIDFATNTVRFPHPNDECTTCGLCGTCKPSFLKAAHDRGRTSVFVGDGTSDRHAAWVADEVFAKGALARWCRKEEIAYTPFTTMDEVAAALLASG